MCCEETCVNVSCYSGIEDGVVCPGGSVELEFNAGCEAQPDCAAMDLRVEIYPANMQAYVTVDLSITSVTCSQPPEYGIATVTLDADAPPGIFTVRLVGEIYNNGNIVCQTAQDATVTVTDYIKVPLGGNVSSAAGCYKAYVPTKWGGKLNIQTTAGAVTDLRYPNGTPYTNNTETGENKHGWYKFRVIDAQNYTVSAAFTQLGEATKRPWNFYWWSTNPPLLNLYETTGTYQPLVKYDARHGTSSQTWEAANHNEPQDWCGHCLGAAIASITLNQPTPVAGSAYNNDEVEALWAELGEQTGHAVDQNGLFGVPAGPPVSGADVTDDFAPILHRTLEKHVKSARIPLYAQLRADGGAATEIWNHAVFKFAATFQEAPGGNEKVVKITNLVTANDDYTPPTDDLATRDPEYVYIITYSTNGEATVVTRPGTDWISVGGEASFAPAILRVVNTPVWVADNPHVIEANVRADDSAN